jgi:hypothetical protein
MSNVVFVPVGRNLQFHPDYNREQHWRYTLPNRDYKTVICSYNSFEPEPNTYDSRMYGQGFKWQLVKKFLTEYDYTQHEYIGLFDDDVVTDIENINTAIDVMKQADAKLCQLSIHRESESSHPILFTRPGVKYVTQTFNEGMCQFVHKSVVPGLLELMDFYEFKIGWGFDMILSSALKAKCIVVHTASAYHPHQDDRGGAYYDREQAFAEMSDVLHRVYPQFMKHKYGEDHGSFNRYGLEFEVVSI